LQEQERAIQQDQIGKAQSLFDQGLLPLPRLQDLQGEESRLSRDLLDNQAFTARARQNKETMKYELDTADIKWRIEVRGNLREAVLDRTRLKGEIEVLSADMALSGDDVSIATEPQVTIYRRVGDRNQPLKADMDTEIHPGDILDVAIAKVPQL
jgi:polysaccharide export outer membrane protein